ncbi:MFS general substrate transporter [Aureobasidium subglaciale]|nr:MFS general substrate transporter [Aureobasidium subglaciale]KAI5213647.1 MFS general substrate transporter [Aureobasidium subglaciale]KAI5215375.1 MFS general substrate transporter [Aureobasidium subglaciale]KAI5253290.1 MFS general substrate transporter [Aureobasidium subglaciale]
MDAFRSSKQAESIHAQDEKSIGRMSSNQAEAEVGQATVPVAQEAGLSFGNILKGNAAHALTPFERKAALVNAELDKFGMGKYQWCIWFLCGFGYFLDLAWSQGVGLAATAIYQEMGVPDARTGDIYSLANAGLAIGAFSFGLLVDVIGRKWAFNLTCLITSVFGLLLAAPKHNYHAICGIYFLASLGLGGNIPIDATITLEFLPQNRRFLVALLSLWQPVGVAIASLLAFGTTARPKWRCDPDLPACGNGVTPCCTTSSNMGWRYLFIILGGMTLVIFFLRYFIFTFQESPKFLVSRGRDAEAIEVLHKIARFNKAPPPLLTVVHLAAIDETYSMSTDAIETTGQPLSTMQTTKKVLKNTAHSFKHLKALFTNKLQMFIFVLLAVAYMGDYWSFNLAGQFLPIILLRNNVSSGATTVTKTYVQYIAIYTPGIAGAIIAMASVQLPLVGRKWSLVFSAICQGLAMAMYTQVNTTAGYVGLNAFEYIMQTYFNAVLYASAPELFDTAYRGSASGMLSCLGRIAGIVAPFAGASLLASQSSGILWLGAGGIWLSALTMIFLPVEMRNRQMF